MQHGRLWDPCIGHHGNDVGSFFTQYFGHVDREVLLVAGAGFDPRACTVAVQVNRTASHMRMLLVKEERPDSQARQTEQAEANTKLLLDSVAESHVEAIQIFGTDGAVVGGRNAINLLSRQCFKGLTDIVVDISALSVGTSFPIIRYLFEGVSRKEIGANLHVLVVHDPCLDATIRATPSDAPGYVHGFKGGATLSGEYDAARLWLPQLATGRRSALGRLHAFVDPHDTCPILPFPATNPRLGDELAEEYLTELESSWAVDTRNIVYAHEGDPVDLYRTILGLADRREPVFAETGGSRLILSPLGSKVMALGALMAALERDLPVAHLETLGYEMMAPVSETTSESNLMHIWLEGDAYVRSRPPCYTEGGTTR